MDNNIILSVKDLNVKFSLRGRILHAIRGVSLDVHKGESLAIVGESGSGKSVFTKTFMGLTDQNGTIESGEILYGGKDLATLVTCTPLGINTHRMLVTGERVHPTPQADLDALGSAPEIPGFPWWSIWLGTVLVLLGIWVYLAGRPRNSGNTGS